MIESRMIKPDAESRPDMVARAQFHAIIIVVKSRIATVELELYNAGSVSPLPLDNQGYQRTSIAPSTNLDKVHQLDKLGQPNPMISFCHGIFDEAGA